MNPFTAKTEISTQDIADLATTAFEGNPMTASWCFKAKPLTEVPPAPDTAWYYNPEFWKSDFQIEVTFDGPDTGAQETRVINYAAVQKGFDLWAEHQPSSFGDFLQHEADAETADIWWQFVVLGDVIYG